MVKKITLNGKVIGKKYGVVVPLGNDGESDDSYIENPNVIYDGFIYKMWYSGYDKNRWSIHYATSVDGKVWTKHGVVLSLGDEGDSDDSCVDTPSVIYDGSKYHMWYSGYDGCYYRIHYAISTDGISWDKQGVVIDLGNIGEYDTISTTSPSVVYDGTTYKMWYTGYNGSDWNVHYATSKNGKNWKKHSVVMLLDDKNKTSSFDVDSINVIYDGSTYKMWYNRHRVCNSNDYNIYYATSTDGITWVKSGIITPLNPIDENDVMYTDTPSVIFDGSMYRMWYTGYDNYGWNIHYAELSEIGLTYKN